MPIYQARREAIGSVIETVRAAIVAHGVSRRFCQEAESELSKLAGRAELFPPRNFPIAPGATDGFYFLHADPDGSNALYLSVGRSGNRQSPHNHLTWAAIAGISGAEHHGVFERLNDKALNKVHERTVGAGESISFMPDEFHSLEVTSSENAVHLHLYGGRIEYVEDRTGFNIPGDGSIRRFKYGGAVLTPVISPDEVATLGAEGRDHIIVRADALNDGPGQLAQACPVIVVEGDDYLTKHGAAMCLWEAGAGEVFVLEPRHGEA